MDVRWFSGLDGPFLRLGIISVLYAISFAGIWVGFLSLFSPARSIRLYQAIMRWFNWKVEPIDERREIRNTKWLGMLMAILSFAIAAILLSGCAHEHVPWGYRAINRSVDSLSPFPSLGMKHATLGVISRGKQEMLQRYGFPTYVSDEMIQIKKSERKLDEWVYVDAGKRFYFFSGSGNLFHEEDLAALDLESYRGHLQAGMSEEQVKRVKGKPDSIRTENLTYGATEKWVYRSGNDSGEAVYFSGGLLLLWQKEASGEDALRGLPVASDLFSDLAKGSDRNKFGEIR